MLHMLTAEGSTELGGWPQTLLACCHRLVLETRYSDVCRMPLLALCPPWVVVTLLGLPILNRPEVFSLHVMGAPSFEVSVSCRMDESRDRTICARRRESPGVSGLRLLVLGFSNFILVT